MGFGEEDQGGKVSFSLQHILWNKLPVWLITTDLAKVVFTRFLHCEVTPPNLLSLVYSLKGRHHAQSPHSKSEVPLYLAEDGLSTSIIWSSFAQEICLFTIYFFNNLFIPYGAMGIFFILWVMIQYYITLIFSLKIFHLLPLELLSVGSYVPLT